LTTLARDLARDRALDRLAVTLAEIEEFLSQAARRADLSPKLWGRGRALWRPGSVAGMGGSVARRPRTVAGLVAAGASAFVGGGGCPTRRAAN